MFLNMSGEYCQRFPHIMNKMSQGGYFFHHMSYNKHGASSVKIPLGKTVQCSQNSTQKENPADHLFHSLFQSKAWPRLLDSRVQNRPFSSYGLLVLRLGFSVSDQDYQKNLGWNNLYYEGRIDVSIWPHFHSI